MIDPTETIQRYAGRGFAYAFLFVLGWHADKIIMSIPIVDKNLLWVISPFVFVSIAICGCLASHQSRISEVEDRLDDSDKRRKRKKERRRNQSKPGQNNDPAGIRKHFDDDQTPVH